MRTFLRSKLHRIRTTGCHLDYVGSVSIGREIMAAAGIEQHEQVDIVNLANGERWTTYALADDRPGTFQMNGGGARLAVVGDRCVVMTYQLVPADVLADGHGAPDPVALHFEDDDLTNHAWTDAREHLGLKS